jgi:hypothetical protein
MNALKSYIIPAGKKGTAAQDVVPAKVAVPSVASSSTSGQSLQVPKSSQSPRPSSLYPQGDFRNASQSEILDIKSDVMVNYLQQQQMERLWNSGSPVEGVVLKKGRGNYTCSPEVLRREAGGFFDQAGAMNVKVCNSHLFD